MPEADREAYAEAAQSRARAIGADAPPPAEEIHIWIATADRITRHVTIPRHKATVPLLMSVFRGMAGEPDGQPQQHRTGISDHPARQTAQAVTRLHLATQPLTYPSRKRLKCLMPGGGQLMASRARASQPVPATVADHPLRQVRRRRGLTLTVLADLSGLSQSFLSMVETGQRPLRRRDHINALAAALRVPPAEIAPSTVPGFDEWAPASSPASAFPAASDEFAVARHRELAGRFIGYVIQGDTYAAGAWLRRMARDPDVNPWLLLDQLTAPDIGLSGPRSRPLGGSWTRLVSAGSSGRGRAG
jgi:transcriptional regulator with XRE-family HTH domain